jgi:SAM-dependent methyltransferase
MDSAASETELRWKPPAASTLRELEAGAGAPGRDCIVLTLEPRNPPVRFRCAAGDSRRFVAASGFRVLRVPVTFGVREEILAKIPGAARRLLDVGCGAGETASEARRRIPGLRATGIDRHPGLAETASRNLDEFFAGDAAKGFAELERRNARFDTIVFADFLEHTEDPYVVLKAALRLAEPGATLVVSVPNAASLPVVEDLLLGRFDPVAAGPADAGHLRWFTRRLLGELLESVGLREIRVSPVPVPSDGAEFLSRLRASGVAHLPDELCAIQWLATAIVPEK